MLQRSFLYLVAVATSINHAEGYGMPMSMSTVPPLGIGAVLFRPKGMAVKPSAGNDDTIVAAGKFFTIAFW